MPHPMVDQLRFTRREFLRCLEGITGEDARRRFEPMNCISWIIGHLATQEQFLWVYLGQGEVVLPDLYELVGYGRPASTPPLDEMWDAWHVITAAADPYLESLTAEMLLTHLEDQGKPRAENIGTLLYRNIYHYWFHTGEAHAVRQMLGHPDLPQFVGGFGDALYREG